MRFWIYHHQHKGKPFQKALKEMGWEYSRYPQIVLFDTMRPQKIFDLYSKMGSVFVLYPHTAMATWWYDGLIEMRPEISAMLCIGEGQAEVQRIILPDMPVYPVGWSYCKQRPLVLPKEVKRITFAPIHPAGRDGKTLRPEAKDINARVYADLLKLTSDVQVIVRMIGTLEGNGLWYNSKVVVKNGKPDGSYDEIDVADLVIAEGMYMYLAVARGKPVIAMNQYVPMRSNVNEIMPANWERYNHLQAYPIDYDDGGGIIENIDRAISENEAVNVWKSRFIGAQLEAKALSETLEKIYADHSQHEERPALESDS